MSVPAIQALWLPASTDESTELDVNSHNTCPRQLGRGRLSTTCVWRWTIRCRGGRPGEEAGIQQNEGRIRYTSRREKVIVKDQEPSQGTWSEEAN